MQSKVLGAAASCRRHPLKTRYLAVYYPFGGWKSPEKFTRLWRTHYWRVPTAIQRFQYTTPNTMIGLMMRTIPPAM